MPEAPFQPRSLPLWLGTMQRLATISCTDPPFLAVIDTASRHDAAQRIPVIAEQFQVAGSAVVSFLDYPAAPLRLRLDDLLQRLDPPPAFQLPLFK